jgi:hypothetical protein
MGRQSCSVDGKDYLRLMMVDTVSGLDAGAIATTGDGEDAKCILSLIGSSVSVSQAL